MDELVVDGFREAHQPPDWIGVGLVGSPFEARMTLDYTDLRGSGSNMYYALIFQVPKWGWKVKKVDEWMEVTPTYAEYYNLTIAQKQKIEGAIKQGLASASQAVSDYDLLAHDVRRYGEIIEYFKKARKDDHVLRSLFIDRVDAHTGEGYSMVTMARRWPTIITDFMRMKSEWTDPEKVTTDKQVNHIMKELDVSQAEATVLKTKNELYLKWKEMFRPVVQDRYARMKAMMDARKKSIDEYKNWLKPYVARYKMMREKTEEKPTAFLSDAYVTPGFGQSQARTFVRIWIYKPYYAMQKGKAETVRFSGIMAKKTKDGKPNKRAVLEQFQVNPYDHIVKAEIPKINLQYGVEVTDDIVYDIMAKGLANGDIDPHTLYYMVIDAKITLDLIKTPPPQGSELDNIVFAPIRLWVMSQNVYLLHLIEVWAREKHFENYVNQMLGTADMEEKIRQHVEDELEGKEPVVEKKPRFPKLNKTGGIFKKGGGRLFDAFVKKGPYEPIFAERISKMYMRVAGGEYGKVTGFLLEKMNPK